MKDPAFKEESAPRCRTTASRTGSPLLISHQSPYFEKQREKQNKNKKALPTVQEISFAFFFHWICFLKMKIAQKWVKEKVSTCLAERFLRHTYCPYCSALRCLRSVSWTFSHVSTCGAFFFCSYSNPIMWGFHHLFFYSSIYRYIVCFLLVLVITAEKSMYLPMYFCTLLFINCLKWNKPHIFHLTYRENSWAILLGV